MRWEEKKARALLAQAEERRREGRADVAAATLCRAFDVLDRSELASPTETALRLEITDALILAGRQAGQLEPVVERASKVARGLMAASRQVGELIRWMALEKGLDTPQAVELYLAHVEADAPAEARLAARLHLILADKLRIRLRSDPDDVRPVIPLLERLHASRPELDYPRLYLGRFHYLEQRFREAWQLLAGIRGPVAAQPRVLNVLARCAEKCGLLDDAEALYGQSLSAAPDQGHIHFRVGRLLLQQFLESRRSELSA